MTMTTPARGRFTSRELNFSRYAITVAAIGSAVSAKADFSSPYAITDIAHPPSTYSNTLAIDTFGNWTSTDASPFGDTVDTSGAPNTLSLSNSNGFNPTPDNLDFTTTAQGAGQVSFFYNFTLSQGTGSFGYLVNGVFTSLASATASSTANFTVAAGDIFGFRLVAIYVAPVQTVDSVAISSFTAPVPEPGVAALVVSGAVGLIALREVRRRNKARLAGTLA